MVADVCAPETVLKWYRELVARKYTAPKSATGGAATNDRGAACAVYAAESELECSAERFVFFVGAQRVFEPCRSAGRKAPASTIERISGAALSGAA